MILLFLLLVPFAAGVISAVARTRRAMENVNLAAFALVFVLAGVLAGQVLSAGSVSLWGGFLYADALSALVCLLTALVALVCSVYAVGYLREDERNGAADLRRYYSLTPLFVFAMLLMALATIRAETGSFQPLSEGISRFNTSPNGHPFDLYDHRRDLGNQGPPDGASFRGRGFVQLTGRANYTHYAHATGHDLVANPDLANQPEIAAELLARFLADKEPAIRRALAAGDLAAARRLVNGGTHGLDAFATAYRTGDQIFA